MSSLQYKVKVFHVCNIMRGVMIALVQLMKCIGALAQDRLALDLDPKVYCGWSPYCTISLSTSTSEKSSLSLTTEAT